jgi:vacuolar-type H+-ATPase subunit H
MKQIVERILREEQLARDRIQAAKKQADESLVAAKKDAQKLLSDADADLARLIEQKRLTAIDEYNKTKDSEITQLRQDVSRQFDQRKKDIPGHVENVFSRVVAPT